MQENRIALAWCFLRVINLTDDAFERLGRYEAALWRQVRHTLFSLDGLRLGRSAKRYRRPNYRWTSRADVASGEDIIGTLVTDRILFRVKGKDSCCARKSAGGILLRNLKVKQSFSIYAIQRLPVPVIDNSKIDSGSSQEDCSPFEARNVSLKSQ